VRAARAADILQSKGYKVVGSCGLAEWKQTGKPLVYPRPKAGKSPDREKKQ